MDTTSFDKSQVKVEFVPHPIPNPSIVFRIFYSITGVSLIVLFVGFGKCLFDIDQISACADHGEYAFTVFKAVGDHIVTWFIALFQEIMGRY